MKTHFVVFLVTSNNTIRLYRLYRGKSLGAQHNTSKSLAGSAFPVVRSIFDRAGSVEAEKHHENHSWQCSLSQIARNYTSTCTFSNQVHQKHVWKCLVAGAF